MAGRKTWKFEIQQPSRLRLVQSRRLHVRQKLQAGSVRQINPALKPALNWIDLIRHNKMKISYLKNEFEIQFD